MKFSNVVQIGHSLLGIIPKLCINVSTKCNGSKCWVDHSRKFNAKLMGFVQIQQSFSKCTNKVVAPDTNCKWATNISETSEKVPLDGQY